MVETVLECRGLTKVFKDFWLRPRVTAVSDLNLEVRRGEVFGLLGPNGSGKSTTIKMILGLLFPTRGRIAVLGKHPTDVRLKERLGFLPEESYLYRFLNARETLDYFGRLFRLNGRERTRRVAMLLEMVGLEAVQHRPVGEYSKGMQRRIGLAQALINDPDLLILDEPTTGLDPLGSRQVKDLILTLKRRGKTVLLSSHLLADVEDVCDRVVILYGGKVRAQGAVSELLTVPDTIALEAPRLRAETIEKIRQLVAAEEGREIRKAAEPRKKLEVYFLELVQRAQEEGAATSGAAAGGAVAEFLAGEAPPEEAAGPRLLEELTRRASEAASAPPVQSDGVGQAPAPAPVRAAVLESLLRPAEDRTKPAPSSAPASPAAPSSVPVAKPSGGEVDKKMLEDLLGKAGEK